MVRGALIAGLVLLGAADLLVLNLVAVPRYLEEREAHASSQVPTAAPSDYSQLPATAQPPVAPPATPPEPVVAVAPPPVSPPAEEIAPEALEPPPEDPNENEPEPAPVEPEPAPMEPASASEEPEPAPVEPEPARPQPAPEAGPPRGVPDLRFGSNSATIGLRASETLNLVAEEMNRNPSLRVLVRGHTDERGSDSLNMGLSRRRADNAAAFLIERGISPERLLVEGVGDAQPTDATGTEAAMARNRRVQVIWR